MLPKRFTGLALAMATVTATGCAAVRHPTAPLSAAVPLSEDVAGTWRGSHGQVAASLYRDNGLWLVRIDDDGTFEATVTPAPGTNNRAKPSTWSGTVAASEGRVVLRSDARWASLTLKRSGDILYGVATDPVTAVPVMIELEREGGRRSTR